MRGGWRAVAIRQGKRLVVWLVAALLVVATVAIVVLGTPYEATDGSIEAVAEDEGVRVTEVDDSYRIEPADPAAGLVFYPGARVDPGAYVASLAPLAREANVTVVIPRMPLNFAIVDYGAARTPLWEDRASAVVDRNPSIDRWYVGGHSLGGAMACRYARGDSDAVEGLVLYAAYCDQGVSDSGLAVLSVVGDGDTVLNRAAYERNQANLPASATVAELPGLNHTQFGSYTGQRGDAPTGTSYGTAHERLNEVAVAWFENQTAG